MNSNRFECSLKGSFKSYSHGANQSQHKKSCKFKARVGTAEIRRIQQYMCSKPCKHLSKHLY